MNGGMRNAGQADVAQMVELSERKRAAYAHYQPVFWRKAENSRECQEKYFAKLLTQDNVIALVHDGAEEMAGFVIATLLHAPQVYDPGGLTCVIDDFCVADEERDWPATGVALLREATRRAKERGAVQAVVVTAHLDQRKQALLSSQGFAIASEWHVRSI